MQGILVFAGFMILWKGLDTMYNAVVSFLNYRLELRRLEIPPVKEEEEEEEEKRIGFQSSNNLVEVDDD